MNKLDPYTLRAVAKKIEGEWLTREIDRLLPSNRPFDTEVALSRQRAMLGSVARLRRWLRTTATKIEKK